MSHSPKVSGIGIGQAVTARVIKPLYCATASVGGRDTIDRRNFGVFSGTASLQAQGHCHATNHRNIREHIRECI
jgi:hypothetical protein